MGCPMSESRAFLIRSLPWQGPSQAMLYRSIAVYPDGKNDFGLRPFDYPEAYKARLQLESLSVTERVAYCGCGYRECAKHYDDEAFIKLKFVGFQRDDDGAPILELRNCPMGNTIAAEVPHFIGPLPPPEESIPDTERP